MDHNNSDEEKCSCGADKKNCANCQTCKDGKGKGSNSEKKYYMCSHGMCKDHDPEWENISKPYFIPNKGFFGTKTYLLEGRCCEKKFLSYTKMQDKKCKKCGRIEHSVLDKDIKFCKCCGYHKETTYERPLKL